MHGTEQVLGTGDVFMARTDKVVIHHQNMLLTVRLEFAHDIRNETLAIVGAVERRHAAKAAVQWTAAGGLNGPTGISPIQQIMTCDRHLAYLGQPSVIPALQPAIPFILQNLWPDALRFPRDDRVHAFHGLLLAHGCVNNRP